MNGMYTFRVVLLMLAVIGVSVASVIFYLYELYFCLFFSVLAIGMLVMYACYAQRHTTHIILRMVESLRYNDFSLNFSTSQKNNLERKLCEEINQVITLFRNQLSEKEERYLYYETLLDIVDSCLLVVDRQQHIHWMNAAAVKNLCGYSIHSLEELDGLNEGFSQLLMNLRPGDVKAVRLHRNDVIQEMAVTVSEYCTATEKFLLIHLTNIRSVLEENEMIAWQKLIRVLTHEIMNSIAPIISLSETLTERIAQKDGMESGNDIILQGMQVIHRRSSGLLQFVENYRKLSKLSPPVLGLVRIGDLLGDIRKLFPDREVTYIYDIETENQMLLIDRAQIEQVLINLLKNAKEACIEHPHPEVRIMTRYLAENQIFQLTVTDNGCGILPEVMDKIFVPFFTTKQKGSGIGLSLCKQIMSLHGGSISVSSGAGEGASFVLKFFCKD